MEKHTEIEKITIGEQLADILNVPYDVKTDYYTTKWGEKTALGLYETVKKILTGEVQ